MRITQRPDHRRRSLRNSIDLDRWMLVVRLLDGVRGRTVLGLFNASLLGCVFLVAQIQGDCESFFMWLAIFASQSILMSNLDNGKCFDNNHVSYGFPMATNLIISC